MRKLVLLFAALMIVTSCGRSEAEDMLYAYQQDKVRALNFSLDDLEFEIASIEKIADITAKDSCKYLKQRLAEYWADDPSETLIDTLTFDYVKDALNEIISHKDTLINLYQEAVLVAIRSGDVGYELDSEKKRDKAIDEMTSSQTTLFIIESLENRYNELSESPDSILSTKYKAVYSQNNPILGNAKQTFEKIFYTNSTQTKFVKDEDVNNK